MNLSEQMIAEGYATVAMDELAGLHLDENQSLYVPRAIEKTWLDCKAGRTTPRLIKTEDEP